MNLLKCNQILGHVADQNYVAFMDWILAPHTSTGYFKATRKSLKLILRCFIKKMTAEIFSLFLNIVYLVINVQIYWYLVSLRQDGLLKDLCQPDQASCEDTAIRKIIKVTIYFHTEISQQFPMSLSQGQRSKNVIFQKESFITGPSC